MMWKMRDGKEINIKDMSTLHIQNCVKMLERNLVTREMFKEFNDIFSGILTSVVPNLPPDSELSKKGTELLDGNESFENRYKMSKEETQEKIRIFKEELYARETN